MKSFIVSIHLPAVAHPDQEGLIGVIRPSGAVDFRRINATAVAAIEVPRDYAETLIMRMYPGVTHRLHGSTVTHSEITDTSAQMHVVRVDLDS